MRQLTVPPAHVPKTFTTKRIFSDAQHQVELYNVGPNPHADEIVVVDLPAEKILFVSDLMMTRITGPFPPLSATDLDFAQKIRKLIYKSKPLPTVTAGPAQWRTRQSPWKTIVSGLQRPIENWILNIRHRWP